MKLSQAVRPITYLKTHAAQLIRHVAEQRQPYVITQNGEARAVLQDIESYEETQESLAMLKLLAVGSQHAAEGQSKPLSQAAKDIRARTASRQ
ncbi:MAG: type II toxin-antitoxin system Phd/YefM family antitoxin [Gemmatimonadetes bacterium]|jgi:prevent-host-death family protein|nr:type II toxin-antitoxin system Phd/YefM family antitoxin [Gemmatimonadota bacterium]MBT6149788.1 type II toxin-antitoxin system Phd/YefM family antitoxin [Gemmatimonadota bacterium]MBT7859110.1 type II toxin-antitoxin system Phd/YefM family antitoxin [Gemmatimonadota bacterium]